MAEVREAISPIAALIVVCFLAFGAGCELEEPRRPVFQLTPTPTPVFPPAPIDSGINESVCEALGKGLGMAARSNLRYGTELTFGRAIADLEAARDVLDQRSDPELRRSINLLLEGIGLQDAVAAESAADTAVRRCKELGYRLLMAPLGFPVW